MNLLNEFAFGSGYHERAGHLRTNAEWLAEARRAAEARVVVVRAASQLLAAEDARLGHLHPSDLPDDADLTFLGFDADNRPVFAVDAGDKKPVHEVAGTFAELRGLAAALGNAEAAIAAQAVAMVGWHRRHRFCGTCGSPTVIEEAGHSRKCPNCGASGYPRTDPAVIMLVYSGDRIVLGKRRNPQGAIWTVLAGFVEPGESLEHAVAREVKEEVGLTVVNATYRGSQPWPFPLQLMLGYFAEAIYDELTVDEELAGARWFTRDEVRAAVASGEIALPGSVSIASHLIHDWLRQG